MTLLDRQRAGLVQVVVSAELWQAPEVEVDELRGTVAIIAAEFVPTPEILFPDPEEGQDLGTGIDALPVQREAAALAAQLRCSFQERHPQSGPSEQARGRQATQTTPDYDG
jgi:hypothetical protein